METTDNTDEGLIRDNTSGMLPVLHNEEKNNHIHKTRTQRKQEKYDARKKATRAGTEPRKSPATNSDPSKYVIFVGRTDYVEVNRAASFGYGWSLEKDPLVVAMSIQDQIAAMEAFLDARKSRYRISNDQLAQFAFILYLRQGYDKLDPHKHLAINFFDHSNSANERYEAFVESFSVSRNAPKLRELAAQFARLRIRSENRAAPKAA